MIVFTTMPRTTNRKVPLLIFSTASVFLLMVLCPAISTTESTQGASAYKYEIPALGRRAKLGEFYDEVSQSFLGVSIFKDKLPLKLIHTNDTPRTNMHYTKTDTFEEKSQLIKLSLELRMSILFGLIQVYGSAEYMNDKKTSTHSVSMFMDYQTRTVEETIEPLHNDIQEFISEVYLQKIKATHIVVGIEYGGDVVVKFEDTNEEQESNEHVSGSLGVAIQALVGLFSANGSAPISATPRYKKKENKLFIKLFGDVSYGSDNPMNFEQLHDFIRKVPALVKQANRGKGRHMSYTLFPLDMIREKFKVNVTSTTVTKLDDDLLQKLIHITSRIDFVQQRVNDLIAEFKNNDMCLTKGHMKELLTLQDKFESHANKFKAQVNKLTLDIRGGRAPPKQLVKVKDDFLSGYLSPDRVTDSLSTQFTPAQEKIRRCRNLIEDTRDSHPVEYFSDAVSLSSFQYKNTGKNVFVLFYSVDFINQNESAWLDQRFRFYQLAQSPANKMAVMDCEFPNANCTSHNVRTVTLVHFKNGRKIETVKEGFTVSVMHKFPRHCTKFEIPALGTTEKLGALYIEKTRQFIGGSVLNVETPFVELEPAPVIDHTILISRQSTLDKLKALNVPVELRLSILTGAGNSLLSNGNIRRYLKEGYRSFSGLVSRFRTMKESLNTSSFTFQNNVNLERAHRAGATHYIHSIFYGGTTIFETPGQASSGLEQLKELKEDLQTIQTLLTNSFNHDKNERCTTGSSVDGEQLKSTSIVTFMSDISTITEKNLGSGGNITLDVKETIQSFFKSLAGVTAGSEARGTPVAYLLLPLHSLEDQVDTPEAPEGFSKPVPELELDFLKHFEDLQLAEDSLLEFKTNFSSPDRKMCVSPSINVEMSKFITEFTHNKSLWIERVKSALELANPAPSVFKELSYEAKEKFTAINVIRQAKLLLQSKFKGLLRKIEMCEWAAKVGVLYLGMSEESSLDEAFWSRETNKDVYLLFLKENWTEGPLWIKALNVFCSLINLQNHRLYLVDCDNSPRLKTYCEKLEKQEPTILKYINGTLVAEIS